MKFLFGLILVALTTYIAPMFMPWWGFVALAGLVGVLIGENGWKSFLYGLLAALLVWGVYAFLLDSGNEQVLSNKMATLFGIDGGNLLLIITAVLGGLLGGLGSMTGSFFRQLIAGKPKRKGYYKR